MTSRLTQRGVISFGVFAQIAIFAFFVSCGTANNQLKDSGNSTADATAGGASSNMASVTWACDGSKFFQNGPLVAQDEYCEWNRSSTTKGSPLQCRFTANFYTDVGVALTSNRARLSQTQFNSWTCLTGERDGNGNTVGCANGSGIVPECIAGIPCEQGTCVPSRASDPAICKALNRLNRAGFGVVMPKWCSNPITLKPSTNLEKNCTSNSTGTIVDCSFQASPYTTCDQVAKEIEAKVTLELVRR